MQAVPVKATPPAEEYRYPTPDQAKIVTVQDSYTNNKSEEKIDKKEKHKIIYQICAAKYQNREGAEKHIATLKKMDVESHLYYDGYKEYRVVLEEVNKKSKAEKIKADYDRQGVFCYIQEL